MSKLPMRAFRAAGLVAMAMAVAQCGDSDVNVIGSGNIDPTAGSFVGATNNGGVIQAVVGSIDSITLTCNGQTFGGDCSPNVDVVNSQAIDTCDGVSFDITFTSNNQATVNDISAGTSCDGEGSMSRVPDGVTPTQTPIDGVTPTTTVDGLTPTPTQTPGGPTPTMTGGDGETPCPTRLTLEGQGAQATLNTGWTGIAFDQTVIERGSLTVALSNCNPGVPGDCGLCDVTGPVESNTAVNNHRCRADTTMTCTADSDCGGSGPCVFLFGSYLPLASGGVPVCVRNSVNGMITGTADIEGGSGASTASLTSQVFSGIATEQPCPICQASSFLATGTCKDGARNGMDCTVHGTSAQFGNTSFDCPPNEAANIGNLPINLSPTTGTVQLPPDGGQCVTIPFTGKDCYCPGQSKSNNCNDGFCTITEEPEGIGICMTGPFVGFCTPNERFRTCLATSECPASGDECVFVEQPCHGPQDPDTLDLTGPLQRTGTPSMTNPVLAATFCIDAVASSAVNTAAGLPGPGTLLLPSKTCFGDETTVCTF